MTPEEIWLEKQLNELNLEIRRKQPTITWIWLNEKLKEFWKKAEQYGKQVIKDDPTEICDKCDRIDPSNPPEPRYNDGYD